VALKTSRTSDWAGAAASEAVFKLEWKVGLGARGSAAREHVTQTMREIINQ
jgi:hypothetical protein